MSKLRQQRRFIKLYIKPLKEKLSEIDGSALKVYLALALEIGWLDNTVEIYSSFHQNEAWARRLSPLLAKLVDTSVT
ncbi:MAG: hypothetical protein DWQ51_06040 [Microcystis wesenbergii TW10]|jgi:hypothetical protein|uniref:Uncharacterized protein n=4 Tax=Microcystis TaxID=1125 RepID=A0A0A1W0S6_MICAE|nr:MULTISPECIES: hypothetical protein [Microcystis]MCZ8098888.1 hypothetical protein [Burkholderiales bacterium]REJ54505.1 MAG: hypothetical protein DWQ51_06040 [Microcystis wesenbergii TW10]TRT88542.1 MAG: hypothetical protein EWV63_06170 [Microcystis aeruginosa Ma_OC_H_19870700_S124]MBD2117025.1 hypothetical protein [Microcystis wesenbergii FACHB-1339]MCZ8039723.1 hypothetical protein [Microcystis sp. LE17-20A]